MVYLLNSSISVCNPPTIMSHLHHPKSRNTTRKPSSNFPVCQGSHSAAIDVLILIAVITASGFLFFPYLKLITLTSFHFFSYVSLFLQQQLFHNPIVYGSLALSLFCGAISTWLLILLCSLHKCGQPNCKGLTKAVEFDLQIETEECIKSPNNTAKKRIFDLPPLHHRQLEAALKKMAPPNGRAVLLFRARCGCSVRRLVVSGPKLLHRKIKK